MAETHPEFRVPPTEGLTTFRGRFQFLLDNYFATRVEAAGIAGVNPDQLAKYVKGESEPKLDTCVKLCTAKGISLEWLGTGKGTPRGGAADDDVEELVYIPIYDVRASSGHGSYIQSEDVRGALAFSRRWINSIVRSSIDDLSVVFNSGESNSPDIDDGDAMLVDKSIDRLEDDAYYVFDEGGVLLVKMIHRLVGGGIILKSRNPAYEQRELSKAEAADVTIFGRVRWRGGAV